MTHAAVSPAAREACRGEASSRSCPRQRAGPEHCPALRSTSQPAGNSAPGGHATMATALALVALVVCPAASRYVVAGVVVAVLTAYFVQGAGRHRPSDILMGAATALVRSFLASVFVPGAGADTDAERGSPGKTSLCLLAVTAAALRWVPEPLGSPVRLVYVAAAAPCAVAVLLAFTASSAYPPSAECSTGARSSRRPRRWPVRSRRTAPPPLSCEKDFHASTDVRNHRSSRDFHGTGRKRSRFSSSRTDE
ncbi:phosphatase PAP2 family protein [Streptomyces parvus]|uniref:phosphatase PAP2 family protein n=1 Tax=Streptomyces parvus TaxID=66428 RepID=UPI0030B91961